MSLVLLCSPNLKQLEVIKLINIIQQRDSTKIWNMTELLVQVLILNHLTVDENYTFCFILTINTLLSTTTDSKQIFVRFKGANNTLLFTIIFKHCLLLIFLNKQCHQFTNLPREKSVKILLFLTLTLTLV